MRYALAALALLLVALPVAAQQGSECNGASATPSSLQVGSAAGSSTIYFYANPNCTFYTSADQAWVRVSPEQFTMGESSVALTVSYDANTGSGFRSGYAVIDPRNGYGGATVYVYQSTRCGVQIVGQDSFSFDVAGGSARIETTVTEGCEVAFASGTDGWIHAGAGGDFTVDRNDGYDRQGAISVGIRNEIPTAYVGVFQSGPAGAPGGGSATPTNALEQYVVDNMDETPGPGVLAAIGALAAVAWVLRRR